MNLTPPNVLELLNKIEAYAPNVPSEVQAFFSRKLWLDRARRELGIDLRDPSLRRDRQSSHEAIFESVRPLGLVGHIMPGNSEWTPLLAILESAITGNTSWVKLPSGSDTTLLLQQLEALGLTDSVSVFTERAEVEELYKTSDAISAWGSESSLEEIRTKISAQTRFIPWGHRISFAYLTKWNDCDLHLAQAIIKYEQQACSSPQVVYLENASFEQACDFAHAVAKHLKENSQSFPKLDDSTWAELSNFSETHLAESCLKEKLVLEGERQEYRIVVDSDASFEASVLNRSILIKPIKRDQIKAILRPHRRLLQTAGVNSEVNELALLSEVLLDAGVSRICPIESMQDAHPLESHDGEFALSRFVKRVVVHAPQVNGNIIPVKQKEPILKAPISTKSDFAQSATRDGDYFFKSGGSSGKAILSPFKMADYHLQMQVAADGLIACGLDPQNDRCMNLFFGGGLYGGFLSFTDILEKTGAPQYPMAGYQDHDFVIETIIEENINVLLGMPSYIMSLYKIALEKKMKLPEMKIFFGGEPFTSDQRSWLKEQGVSLIRSASYGSVDAGPLGYQCKHSDGGVHHVNTTIQNIEIVDLNCDKACEPGVVGRVLVTSKARSGVKIERYQLGDTAKWIAGECDCGDPAPRLELVGRVGDIFKFGGSFLNARKFAQVIGAKKIQFILTKDDLVDNLIVISDKDVDEARELILQESDLYEVVVLEKSCKLRVQNDGYELASSGKTPLLIDRR